MSGPLSSIFLHGLRDKPSGEGAKKKFSRRTTEFEGENADGTMRPQVAAARRNEYAIAVNGMTDSSLTEAERKAHATHKAVMDTAAGKTAYQKEYEDDFLCLLMGKWKDYMIQNSSLPQQDFVNIDGVQEYVDQPIDAQYHIQAILTWLSLYPTSGGIRTLHLWYKYILRAEPSDTLLAEIELLRECELTEDPDPPVSDEPSTIELLMILGNPLLDDERREQIGEQLRQRNNRFADVFAGDWMRRNELNANNPDNQDPSNGDATRAAAEQDGATSDDDDDDDDSPTSGANTGRALREELSRRQGLTASNLQALEEIANSVASSRLSDMESARESTPSAEMVDARQTPAVYPEIPVAPTTGDLVDKYLSGRRVPRPADPDAIPGTEAVAPQPIPEVMQDMGVQVPSAEAMQRMTAQQTESLVGALASMVAKADDRMRNFLARIERAEAVAGRLQGTINEALERTTAETGVMPQETDNPSTAGELARLVATTAQSMEVLREGSAMEDVRHAEAMARLDALSAEMHNRSNEATERLAGVIRDRVNAGTIRVEPDIMREIQDLRTVIAGRDRQAAAGIAEVRAAVDRMGEILSSMPMGSTSDADGAALEQLRRNLQRTTDALAIEREAHANQRDLLEADVTSLQTRLQNALAAANEANAQLTAALDRNEALETDMREAKVKSGMSRLVAQQQREIDGLNTQLDRARAERESIAYDLRQAQARIRQDRERGRMVADVARDTNRTGQYLDRALSDLSDASRSGDYPSMARAASQYSDAGHEPTAARITGVIARGVGTAAVNLAGRLGTVVRGGFGLLRDTHLAYRNDALRRDGFLPDTEVSDNSEPDVEAQENTSERSDASSATIAYHSEDGSVASEEDVPPASDATVEFDDATKPEEDDGAGVGEPDQRPRVSRATLDQARDPQNRVEGKRRRRPPQ